MSSLPVGWEIQPLDALSAREPRSITDGPFGSNLTSAHYTTNGARVVRLQNIGDGLFIDNPAFISMEHFATLRSHSVEPGDLLVASLGETLPRACIAPAGLGPAIVKADCIRVRLSREIEPRWVLYALQAPATRKWASDHLHGVGRPRLGLRVIRSIPVAVPPIDEQRRIVEILEDHLSRLDAADAYLTTSARRLATMSIAGLWQATHGLDGAVGHRLHDVADVRLGRQRSPKNHQGDRMVPYMRAANVDWNRLRLDDVKAMQFTAAESAIYELRHGDILLTEASGSASEVGKSVLYRGEVPGACFQNTLLRVRCRQGNPEFVQRYLLAEARAGRFRPQSRGVGIHHLGRQRLADFPIELPPLDRQVTAVAEADDVLDGCERLRAGLEHARRMQQQLRRALLHAAFTGRLTGHASDTDRAEELAATSS